MTNILSSIVEYKTSIVRARKEKRPLSLVKEQAAEQTQVRGFVQALENQLTKRQPAIVAECKKGSPSKGIIVTNYNAETIALEYEKAGATCISVLTDEKFFHGGDRDLSSVKKIINTPVLRKDFIIDTYQVYETKAIGADCILLITACLSDKLLDELFQVSTEIGLDVLVEVHNRTELERALRLRGPLIGINNRNLKLFETNIRNTIGLLKDIPEDRIVISESGISSRRDIEVLLENDVNCFLIGETFLRAENPGDKLRDLFPELN